MIRRSWFVLVLMVAAVACGSDGDDVSSTTSGSTPETASTAESAGSTATLDASHQGVTAEAISIAVPIVDEETIARDFSVELNWGDQQAKYDEAIARVNDAGGVNGRRIDATFIEYVPVSQNDTDRVCLEAVEDLGVFAVVGFIRPDSGVLCLTETNETPFVGGGDVPTEETRRRSVVPALYPAIAATRLDEALVEVTHQQGALDGKRLAVHGRDEARLDEVEAALAERGYEAATRTVLSAPETDAQAMAADLDIIVERWQADDIDLVLNVTTNISMLSAVNRAGLEIDIATNSTDVALGPDAVFAQGATEREVERVTLVTVTSSEDAYDSGHEPTTTCIDGWNDAHPEEPAVFDPGEDDLDNLTQVVFACQNVELFTLVATAAGTDLTPDSMAAALDGLDDVELAGITSGSLSAEKWDVNDSMAVYLWDTDTQDFESTGETYDVG